MSYTESNNKARIRLEEEKKSLLPNAPPHLFTDEIHHQNRRKVLDHVFHFDPEVSAKVHGKSMNLDNLKKSSDNSEQVYDLCLLLLYSFCVFHL